jgi:hypothetical protein
MIPHIDPGRVKYGKQPQTLLRVMYLCWIMTLAMSSYIMSELEEMSSEDELSHREDMCNKAILRYQNEAADLIHQLEMAKQELEREWGSQNAARNILDKETRSQTSTFHAQV